MTDREKLIERLRETASFTPPICQYDRPIELDVMGKKITAYCKPFEQFQDLLREAADAIANGVVVREWIPVTERLPEDGVRVLAAHDDGVVRIGISRGYFPAVVSKNNAKAFGIAEVTHWMPLPEPPTRKGENDNA